MMTRYVASAVLGAAVWSGMIAAADKGELKSTDDKVSYSVGHQIGEDFKRQGVALNAAALVKGIEDAIAGGEGQMTREEMRATLVELKKRILEAQHAELKQKAEKNLKEATAFLAENAKKEGVKTLPSGLQYKVLKEGSGPTPKADDSVTVHYRGTLIDGTEFDSSYKREKPATFQVDQVIPGWTEALQLMKVGSKWQLFIPPSLAYAERGAGTDIGPNSALIFEVELLSIAPGGQGGQGG